MTAMVGERTLADRPQANFRSADVKQMGFPSLTHRNLQGAHSDWRGGWRLR